MKHTYAAVVLAIKNDFCVEETVVELLRQGVQHAAIISPFKYWTDDSPQPAEDLEELSAIAQRTGALLVRADFKSPRTDYTPLHTEALYRNYAIELMLSLFPTVDYLLTVDADEFWMPGALAEVDALADSDPLTICLPGIPVLGVPGLPVAGAKDAILAATSRTVRFTWGRATEGPRQTGTIPVIHFSTTRRTLQAVIDKCRKSAHYGDPNYDFDGWIEGASERAGRHAQRPHV
jgi:hypothetical protein